MEDSNIHHLLNRLSCLYECRSAKELPDAVQQVLSATVECDLTGWYDVDERYIIRSYNNLLYPMAGEIPDFDRQLQKIFLLHPFTRYIMDGGKDKVMRLSDFDPVPELCWCPLFKVLKADSLLQYALGTILKRPGDGYIALSISRTSRDFDSNEMQLVANIMEHIRRHASALGLLGPGKAPLPESSIQTCLEKLNQSFGLTPREAEIAYWAAHGKTNQDIAIILSLSPHTVRTHLQNIFTKMMLETRAALAHTVWHICA
jgi:DNA-binding CsgD family transcriptional regulator